MSRLLAAALAVTTFALVAAPAAPANFAGVAEEPAGDSIDPDPARDITGAGMVYDRRTGDLRGVLRLGAAPDADAAAFIGLFAGVRNAAGACDVPALVFTSFSDDLAGNWNILTGPQPGPGGTADKQDGGEPLQFFAADDARLAGHRPDCVYARLTDPADPAIVYDHFGPIPLAPRPALSARLRRVPRVMEEGRPRRIRLTLRNPGDAATGPIELKIGRRRGLSARAPRTVPSLRAGQRRTITITTSLSRRASSYTPLRVTATAAGLRVRVDTKLTRVGRPQPDGGGDGSSCAGGFYNIDINGSGSFVPTFCP
jgi:hypothetical protein